MWEFCFFVTVIGCLSFSGPSYVISAYTFSDKTDRGPLALDYEDNPDRCEFAACGKEFILAVTEQIGTAGTFIYIFCASVTTINLFSPYVNMNKTLKIGPGTKMIRLDDRLMNSHNELTNKGVYVTADKLISIYVIEDSNEKFATEGYVALPVSAISTEYVVATDYSASNAMSQFVIASVENNTRINVMFKTTGNVNINGITYTSGDIFSQEMSKLDTFQVQHNYDLTGTLIQSSKPIAVFSGCICGDGPFGGACQHEVEQIFPVSSLGHEYITVPLFPAASYRYRIIAPFNNTITSIKGQSFAIESGNFLERWDSDPIYIHASKPVMVIEYGQCTDAKCQNGSDPSMITIPSISTFPIHVAFELPENITWSHIHYYLIVIIKTDRANGLMLDNKSLNLEDSYSLITDSRDNYTVLVTNITSGYHKLHHTDTSVRYGALLYGTGQWTSIGFPLGYHTGPSKPSVTFIPTGTQNIMLIIAIVDGQATGYEVKVVSIASGRTYTHKGILLPNETISVYNFTTTQLPGTCFNFSVVATSGSGQWVSSSAPVVEPNVCYGTGNITRPVVRSEIQRVTNDGDQLVFHCDFDPSSDPSVLYQVTWYRGVLGSESKLMSSTHTSYDSRERFRSLTYLPEGLITLGMTIFCTISAAKLSITVTSEPYFVGFEVISKNSLKLKYLEETLVYIRLSVPFGCRGQSVECFLGVNMFYMQTGADDCLLPAVAAMSNCGVRISSWKWNHTYPIRLALKHGQNLLSISRMYNIRFRTDETFEHEFFRNYTIPSDIQVEVTTDSADLNGKECHAVCDPHMQTFDGRNYENQNEGTYILYKHLKSPIQVQMKTNPCYGFREGPPFCPCGVAISSGRDVFVVDRCSIPITIYMPQCDDGTLKGKIKSDGKFYQIYLTSGSWIKITSGISFNIYMYPSISDIMATSGLCGYLDGDVQNDFVLRNRTHVPDYRFEEFNSNWLVKPEEDLFNISNYNSLPSWPRADYRCVCGDFQDSHIAQSENCSPDIRKFCPESGLNDSLAADCSRTLITKSNAAIELDPSDFNASQTENDTMTEIPIKSNFTENSAIHECWSYLNKSLLFEKCSKVPDIYPESFAKTCAKDVMITKTMFWAPTHLDNAQKRCIYQVTVNQPLPEHIIKQYNVISNSDVQSSNKTINGTDVHTSPSLQELKDLDCLMNCNQQGDCIKGQCHCYKGYGSDDCSVDMNKAPTVYGIPNRGVCDLQESSCDKILVLGENFAKSQSLSCRLSLFQVMENETMFHDDRSIILEAQWISFAEVSCPIKDVRSKRSVQFPDDHNTLAIGFKVAVGNTREIFGRNISLLVVDALCVDCTKDGFDIRCTLKDEFELINRQCNKKISAEKKVQSGPTILIISTVVGSVLVVIVVGVLLHYCLVVRAKRAQYEKDKRERAYAELQEMERKKEYYGTIEEVYDDIKDLPGDYSTILDSVPACDESKSSKGNYVQLSSTQKNASEGYSCLNKLSTNECESNARENENKVPTTSLEKKNIHYQTRPLPSTGVDDGPYEERPL